MKNVTKFKLIFAVSANEFINVDNMLSSQISWYALVTKQIDSNRKEDVVILKADWTALAIKSHNALNAVMSQNGAKW